MRALTVFLRTSTTPFFKWTTNISVYITFLGSLAKKKNNDVNFYMQIFIVQ